MESKQVMGYVLHVNGRAVAFGHTFQECKIAAEQYLSDKPSLQIVSSVAPAPSQKWYYDYAISQWVEGV